MMTFKHTDPRHATGIGSPQDGAMNMGDGKMLADRVALVTGGGGEIGGAIAERFGREGAKVLVADIDPGKAEAVAARVRAAGGDAQSAECNVADPAHAERAVGRAVGAFGRLTTLVNVAATVIPDGNAETLSLDDWNKTLAVNLTGAFLMCKFAIPEIRKAGGGTIVNITSQLGQIGVPRKSPYSTSKAALIQLSKCLAVDYAQDNIRVNSLSPGAIDTARSLRHFGTRENANKARGPLHLLGRTGRVDEIAAGAAFLASDESSFMTGADLLLDGGYLAFKGSLETDKR
jgi:NAD(P)-dependent dehydrogenase (short-subunit alcohol dehydrogenase family)